MGSGLAKVYCIFFVGLELSSCLEASEKDHLTSRLACVCMCSLVIRFAS